MVIFMHVNMMTLLHKNMEIFLCCNLFSSRTTKNWSYKPLWLKFTHLLLLPMKMIDGKI